MADSVALGSDKERTVTTCGGQQRHNCIIIWLPPTLSLCVLHRDKTLLTMLFSVSNTHFCSVMGSDWKQSLLKYIYL